MRTEHTTTGTSTCQRALCLSRGEPASQLARPRLGGFLRPALVGLLLVLLPALTLAQAVPTKHPLFSKAKPTAGDYDEWLVVNDTVRTYRLHLPARYNHLVPLPLVLMLHDEGSDPKSVEATTRLSAEADKAEFIVAYPNGSGEPRSWNAGHCCGAAAAGKVDDIAFLEAIIDTLVESLSVDDTRVGIAGLGNGAMLAYSAALQLSPKVAAVAVVAGSLGPGPNGAPLVPMPPVISPFAILVLHAQDDAVVPFVGGAAGEGAVKHLPARDTVAYFARLNRCGETPTKGPTSNEAVTIESYSGCADAVDVMLYTLASGGHGWPTTRLPGDLSASSLILDFVIRHPKS